MVLSYFASCRSLVGESEREAERRANLNTVYWASGNYRFLLVGPAPAETMEKLADVVQSRFAS